MKLFIKSMLVRAAYTFAETMIGLIIVGQTFTEIDWIHALSVSGVAAVVSILKSVIVGLPEAADVDLSGGDKHE